ncbi:MAG TPA: glycoside hydrolase family 43 protein [Bacteroidaceae bacterium]|nr:glycoside hydrolase family 43 protein [Bacteroidaceae bacterium]
MRRITFFITIVSILLLFLGCKKSNNDSTARFSSFSYSSQDSRYSAQEAINPDSFYINPILAGCYPDPSICRKGDDYYLVNSTFVYYPGIPIWHSTDLVNWEHIRYVLDRPSQLSFPAGISISSGIYAPAISYNPHNDTFYLIVTGVGNGGNFIVKTDDPSKDWSDPIFVPEVGGIDPSLFFDNDGRAYIVNNDAPAGVPEYDGHRAIWIHEFDVATDKVIGQSKLLIDKGVVPSDKPIWIEAPHIHRVNDVYYLIAAEGGTAENHSEVVFVSNNPKGPYKPCPVNPILTQRNLDPDRPFPITCTGHADIIQTPEGDWWAVFLGVLPYERDKYSNTGRSTFLLPVKWENGQPIILDNGLTVPTFVEKPKPTPTTTKTYGNFSYTDNFDSGKDLKWMTLRSPGDEWNRIINGTLEIDKRDVSLSDIATPSFLCQWIKHSVFTATTTLEFTPDTIQDLAGLACYMNENFYFAVGKSMDENGDACVKLISRANNRANRQELENESVVKAVSPLTKIQSTKPIHLKVEANGRDYTFFYSFDGKKWLQIGETLDGTNLSISVAGGFTGAVVGLFASSSINPKPTERRFRRNIQ